MIVDQWLFVLCCVIIPLMTFFTGLYIGRAPYRHLTLMPQVKEKKESPIIVHDTSVEEEEDMYTPLLAHQPQEELWDKDEDEEGIKRPDDGRIPTL